MLCALRHSIAPTVRRTVSTGVSSSLLWFSSASNTGIGNGSEDDVRAAIDATGVVIFSKSWCPFCRNVKVLFDSELKVPYTAYELDELPQGDEIQQSLVSISGQRTVPNVFIGGKHVGGSDDTFAAHRSGKLQDLLDSIK